MVILNTSYENVKRLQREGHLRKARTDPNGIVLLDRQEVEALARKRLAALKPSGELTATVFTMFEEGRTLAAVCIATKQDADTILRLWDQYTNGFRTVAERAQEERELRKHEVAHEREDREQREHDERVLKLEEDLEKQRRRARGIPEEDDEWPAVPPKPRPLASTSPKDDDEKDGDGDEGEDVTPVRRRRANGGGR